MAVGLRWVSRVLSLVVSLALDGRSDGLGSVESFVRDNFGGLLVSFKKNLIKVSSECFYLFLVNVV